MKQPLRITSVLPQVIIFVVAISLALSGTAWAMPPQQSVTGLLRPLAGLVQFQAPGQGGWTNVAADTQIVPGSQIRTSNDGYASLLVSNNNTLLIYPTSLVEFSGFLGTEGASNVYAVTQYIGTMHVSSNKAVGNDLVSVITPAAGLVIRGTDYVSFLSNKVSGNIIVNEGNVQVRTANQSLTANPNTGIYYTLAVPRAAGLLCSELYLAQNTIATAIINTVTSTSQLNAIKSFLEESLASSVHPAWQAFLRQFFGLTPIDFGTVTPEQEATAFQELVGAIRGATTIDFAKLLADYRAFITAYESLLDQNSVASASCGNGVQDAGETVDNCAADFPDAVNRGNGLCEINRGDMRESIINNAEDCGLSNQAFIQSCVRTQFDLQLPVIPRTPRPTRTPLPTSTPRGTL